MLQSDLFDAPPATPVPKDAAQRPDVSKTRVPHDVSKTRVPHDAADARRRYDAACGDALRLYAPGATQAGQTEAWREACRVAAERYAAWQSAAAAEHKRNWFCASSAPAARRTLSAPAARR